MQIISFMPWHRNCGSVNRAAEIKEIGFKSSGSTYYSKNAEKMIITKNRTDSSGMHKVFHILAVIPQRDFHKRSNDHYSFKVTNLNCF